LVRISITHHHLLGLIATEAASELRQLDRPIRILDVGCGDGHLIDFLQRELPRLLPNKSIELHGLEVRDSRVQKSDFFGPTIRGLAAQHPAIPWNERLSLLHSESNWPFDSESFDFVISNQVLEHVRDHAHLMRNIARVLVAQGVSAHLFPLRDSYVEWHLKMPFAHWIGNSDYLYSYIALCSWLGLGTWRTYCRLVRPVALSDFSAHNRDFVAFETNYLRERDIALLAKSAGLKYCFRYTMDFYLNRIRLALGWPLQYRLRARKGVFDRVAFSIFRRTSSVCLVLEKGNSYSNVGYHTPREENATIC
jgi:SAM-dependent methyltransferase